MKRKAFVAILATAMVAETLTGCGTTASTTTTASSASVEEASTEATEEVAEAGETAETDDEALQVWVREHYYNDMVDAAAKFTEETGIKVQVTQPSDMSDDLALALSSGDAPDVVSIDCVLVPYYASIGAFMDITDKFDALEYKDQFTGGLIELASYDGKQYAMPFSPDCSVLLYNKDMFREAGLDPDTPPTSWEELIADAQALTNDDHYGYVFGAGDGGTMMFTFCPYIWSNGGEFTSEDGSESMLNQPEAVEALQLMVDMVYEYQVTPESITSYDWTAAVDAFSSQKAAMITLGSSAVGNIVNGAYDFDAGCALIPAADGENFSSFSGGDALCVLADTDKGDAAWQFVQYCMSEEVQVDLVAANGDIPARMDLFDNELYTGHSEYDVLREALKVGKAPYSLKYNEMYTPWLDAIQYALNQEKTPQEAFDDAKTEIDQILAED